MLKFSMSKSDHNRQQSGQTIQNNVDLKSQNKNFLHDVILPQTLDIENMRIIKKYNHTNSPQTITKKIVQMKKNKIQKKIQSIVTKNTQNAKNQMNNVQRVTKYKKQNVKSESKFAQHDKYKKSLFEEQISVEKMKLFCDGSQICTPVKKSSQIDNQFDDFAEQQKENPFIINMDEKLGEKRLMQEQVFEPLKQKIKKAIDKTINKGVNSKVNGLMEKINFYLTSLKETPFKQKIKRVTVDVHKTNEKVKSYCEEIEKGGFLKTQNLRISKQTDVDPRLRQYRSKSSCNKARPLTPDISLRTPESVKGRAFLSSNRASSASTSRLNRFAKSTSQFNIKHKTSNTQTQKKHMDQLLNQIESTCWQSHFDTKIISKKMQKMSNQWVVDEKGIRICENKRISMTEETLELLKKMRRRVPQVEEIEQQLLEKDQ